MHGQPPSKTQHRPSHTHVTVDKAPPAQQLAVLRSNLHTFSITYFSPRVLTRAPSRYRALLWPPLLPPPSPQALSTGGLPLPLLVPLGSACGWMVAGASQIAGQAAGSFGGAVRVVQYIKSSHTKPGPPAGCSISLPSHPTPAATRLQLEAVHNLALAGLPLRPCPNPLFLPRRTCRLPRGLGSRKVGLLQHPARRHLRIRGGTIVMGCLHTLLRCKNAERMACTAAHQQQRRWGCNATEQVWLLPKCNGGPQATSLPHLHIPAAFG